MFVIQIRPIVMVRRIRVLVRDARPNELLRASTRLTLLFRQISSRCPQIRNRKLIGPGLLICPLALSLAFGEEVFRIGLRQPGRSP
jgi:hypothetical protein